MRRVIVSMYLTLDGVMEEPRWSFAFWNDEMAKYARDQLFASDALLLGRVTYEGFVKAWPSRTDEQGFADRMNALPKYVASTTLKETTWNATRITGDLAEAVTKLKRQPGQNILVYGSAELVRSLMKHNLVDEYRFWVHPIVVGSGKRFLPEGSVGRGAMPLRLAGSKSFSSGVVVLSYQKEK